MSVVAACGDDDDDDGGGGGGGGSGEAKSGGSITISQTSQPDFLDPALTLHGERHRAAVARVHAAHHLSAHRRREKDSRLIPGLAEEMPTISEDGKTYELTLRKGLKYSDGSPVKASDFEHAIKRVLNLESGGSAFYLGITGAQDYIDAGKCDGDISGIETDDKTGKITINLDAPDGSFSHVLAMWFAGLVPSDTPCKNLTEEPAAGRRPVHVHGVGAEPAVRDGEEPELPGPRAGHPAGQRRQDHDQDHQERRSARRRT